MPITLNGTTGIVGPDGSASTPAIQGSDANTGMFFPAADTIAFAEGGAEVARFDSSGNLLVAGTSSIFTSFGGKIVQANNTNANSSIVVDNQNSGSSAYAGLNLGTSGNNWAIRTGSTAANSNRLDFVLDVSSPSVIASITSAGNLGIGTTSPASKFAVVNSGAGFEVNPDGTGGGPALIAYNRNTSAYLQMTGNALLHTWQTSGTERARIDSSGNLLVGGNAQVFSERLLALGTGANVFTAYQNTNTSGLSTIRSFLQPNGNNTSTYHFLGTTSGVNSWYLYGNGTSSWSSDARLKKNIETTRDGYLEDVCKLRVVKYNWKSDAEGAPRELGLIAQEVESVFPGLVQDGLEPLSEDDPTLYKQLKSSVLPFMLLKAIQEQQALIQAQSESIAALMARVQALEGQP